MLKAAVLGTKQLGTQVWLAKCLQPDEEVALKILEADDLKCPLVSTFSLFVLAYVKSPKSHCWLNARAQCT